jgi:hypothetical protein
MECKQIGDKTKTKVNEKEKPRSINRQVAPCMRERKKRINHQTKYFVSREDENKKKRREKEKKKLYIYN